MGAELVSHQHVREFLEHPKSLEELEIDSRMSIGRDIRQVVARGFNVEGWDLLPQDACGVALDGRVSTSVKHQTLFSAEKAA